MKTNKTQKAGIYLSLLFFFFLHACNLPSETEPKLSLEAQAGTLAAQTVEASKQKRPTKTRVPRSTPTQVRPSKTPTPVTTETPTPTQTQTQTQTSSVPKAPGLQNYDFFCSWNGSGVDLTITIEWSDKSNNELGFIIRRNGTEIAKLPPNTTSYFDAYAVSSGQVVNYAVQAYNNSGVSKQLTLSATCE